MIDTSLISLPSGFLHFDSDQARLIRSRMPKPKCWFPFQTSCGREILEIDAFTFGQGRIGGTCKLTDFDFMVMRFAMGMPWVRVAREAEITWSGLVWGRVIDVFENAYKAQRITTTIAYRAKA